MNITLNGKPHMSQAPTIAALVAELGLNLKQVAIERNGAVVPRSSHAQATLAEGDNVEILAFIGGG